MLKKDQSGSPTKKHVKFMKNGDPSSDALQKKGNFIFSKQGHFKTDKPKWKKNAGPKLPDGKSPGMKSKSYISKKSNFQKKKPFKKHFGKEHRQAKYMTQKGLKRKPEESSDAPAEKKIKLYNLKKKERKEIRQKSGNKSFELSKQIKVLSGELNSDACKTDRKNQLLEELFKLVKGCVKQFVFAHDTVRVLECILAKGTEVHRTALFEELKDDVILLAKSKYAKFFLIKMLSYGTKQQKEFIMKSFHGKVIELVKHTEAAEVVEAAFNECTSALQRAELLQEFYGASYKFFKSTESQSLQQLLDKNPEQKPSVINHMKEVLSRILEKSIIKHSIVHCALLQFMLHCDEASRSEIIESLRESVAEFLHTKEGSKVAMHCIWHGTVKDRKAIVKHLKPFVMKIAMEEYGHMVLLALFDCVDDTKLLEKYIITEINKNMLEISQNLYGKKVLIHLLSPRDPHFFCPAVITILKTGDGNKTSKKDPELRLTELRAMVEQHLLLLIKSGIQTMYTNNPFCLFVLTVLKNFKGDKTEVFKSIAELAVESYSSENKNVHIIEHSGSHFLLKQLILQDQQNDDKITFSETLINVLPENVMKTWINCNRGCFLLVSLFESGILPVIERIRNEMIGQKKQLMKKPFKGAEILLEKLKQ